MGSVEVRLFGRFSVRRDSEEVPPSAFGGRLTRSLVRILVAHRGSFVSRDYLTEALWSARPPRDPGANLRVLVNRARTALGDARLIETGPGGYAFDVERRCEVDAETFLARVEAGRQRLGSGQARAALIELRAALELWKEPLPEDVYEEWAQEYRGQLLRAHLEALESAAEACLSVDDPRQAVMWAEQAAAREPLRETANLLLVRALALAGDTAGALDSLNCFRRRLAEELGLDPTREAAELETCILRGEPLRPRLRRPIVSPLPPQSVELAFVGREHEIDTILGHLKHEHAATLEVVGQPGAGKTRLMWEVGARAGMAVVSARVFPGDRDEPWSLARSLLGEAMSFDLEAARALPPRAAQALCDIVPEIEQLHPTERSLLDPESRRALALQGAIHLLQAASATGLLVIIDDLHWADTTSLALLRRLIPQTSRLSLMFAYRPEEIPPEGPLSSFLDELPRLAPNLLRVPVEPLSPRALATLIADPELARVMTQETDRTPLAVGEVLRALAERGVVHADPHHRWYPRSQSACQVAIEAARAGKREVITSRVQAQPPLRRRLLCLLALAGREVPARLLASACGVDQITVLEGLEQLGAARLVHLGEHAWGVAHPFIAQTAADNLKRPERALLHGMLARALATEGSEPSELAHHLAQAGDSQAAAEAFVAASRDSLDHFATEEAEQLAEAGLRLDPNSATASVLLEMRAEARARRGDHAGACEDLRAALAGRRIPVERARILARLAMVSLGGQDFRRADELVDLALAEAGTDERARAQALAVGAIVDINLPRLERAETRVDEALALFEALGDGRGMAGVAETEAILAFAHGRLRDAVDPLQRAAHLLEDSGELFRVGMARGQLGLLLVLLGRPEEALPHIHRALELDRLLGNIEGEMWAKAFQAWALAAMGRVEEACEEQEEVVAVCRRLGHRSMIAAALFGLGIVYEVAGELGRAEEAFRESVEAATSPLISSWAAARLAGVLVNRGDLARADEYLRRALTEALPMSRLEAELVRAQLALVREEPGAEEMAADALRAAEASGWMASAARARLLSRTPFGPR